MSCGALHLGLARVNGGINTTSLFSEILKNFPQISMDMSLFTNHSSTIEATNWHFSGLGMRRVNFNWEDDAEFMLNSARRTTFEFDAEQKIFNFHPIHIGLNSSDGREYQALKAYLESNPLNNCSQQQLRRFKNKKHGTRDTFEALINCREHSLNDLEELL